MTQDEFRDSELGQKLQKLPAAKFSLFRDLARAIRRGYFDGSPEQAEEIADGRRDVPFFGAVKRTALRIVLVSRTEAAVRIDQLVTVQRSGDWMACLAGNPNVWGAGATEAEALGKLVISLRGRGAAQ